MMDEYTADAFVNRDEPIPVLRVPAADDGSAAPAAEPKGFRERLKAKSAGTTSKFKDKVQESVLGNKDHGYSLQDRLFTK